VYLRTVSNNLLFWTLRILTIPIPCESIDDWLAVEMHRTTSLASSIGYFKSKGPSWELSVRRPCLTLICHPRTCSQRREIEISSLWVSRFSSADTADASSRCWTSISQFLEQFVFRPRPFQIERNVSSTERNKFARSTKPYSNRGSSD
jgi:hypothetical protein